MHLTSKVYLYSEQKTKKNKYKSLNPKNQTFLNCETKPLLLLALTVPRDQGNKTDNRHIIAPRMISFIAQNPRTKTSKSKIVRKRNLYFALHCRLYCRHYRWLLLRSVYVQNDRASKNTLKISSKYVTFNFQVLTGLVLVAAYICAALTTSRWTGGYATY